MTLGAFLAPHVAALREKYLVTAAANLSNGEERRIGPEDDLSSLRRRLNDMRLPHGRGLWGLLEAHAHER